MKYTDTDKTCPHCGGNLEWHSQGDYGVIKWCDDCGSNDSELPPNVSIKLEDKPMHSDGEQQQLRKWEYYEWGHMTDEEKIEALFESVNELVDTVNSLLKRKEKTL